jgi:hypothetical protein
MEMVGIANFPADTALRNICGWASNVENQSQLNA